MQGGRKMYLKVAEAGINNWFIIECYKIHYERVIAKIFIDTVTKKPYLVYSDCDRENLPINGDLMAIEKFEGNSVDEHEEIKLVIAHLGISGEKEYKVVFDTIAYLMNDSGETIETITV